MTPPDPIAVSAPPRVADRLRTAADGPVRVVHRGPHALYLEVGGWCVGLVDAQAVAVPCALRTLALPTTERAEMVSGVLHLDGRPVRPGRYVAVAVPRLPVEGRPQVECGSLVECRGEGRATAYRDQPGPLGPAEVAGLVGVGEGLTPYGDDVLCGWLAVHRAAGVPTPEVDAAVRAALPRTSLLSATLLDCALAGEVVPQFAAWLRSLGTAEEPAHADRLSAVGHTSGLGLLRGARRALAGLGLEIGAAA